MNADEEKKMLHRMRALRIPGLADTYLAQKAHEPDYVAMPFEDRLKELIDAAWHLRTDHRTERLVQQAHLAMPHACFEDVDYCIERSFDVRTFKSLQSCDFIERGFHVIIAGAVGSGKTYLSSALGFNACRAGYKVRSFRTSELFELLHEAEAIGEQKEFLRDLHACRLLILDEFLLTEVSAADALRLFEIVAERSRLHRSMVFCTHYLPDGWCARLGNDPVAESILDRIMAGSYLIHIESTISMRSKYEGLQPETEPVDADAELSD